MVQSLERAATNATHGARDASKTDPVGELQMPTVFRFWLVAMLMAATGLSVGAQQNELRSLAVGLAQDISSAGKKAVAVVDFTDLQGNPTELGRYLAEEFSVALTKTRKGFDVIDRTHLKTVLAEHKLASTGLIDPTTAKKLGEMVGADALLTGSMTPFSESVRVAIKVVATDTSRIVAADTVDLPKTATINELLRTSIDRSSSGAAQTLLNSRLPERPRAEQIRSNVRRAGQLEITLQDCRSAPEGTFCEGLVNNLGEQRLYCLYSTSGPVKSRIVDERGNVYEASRIQIAESTAQYQQVVCATLPNAVPVVVRLLFPRLHDDVTRLELVELVFDFQNNPHGTTHVSAQFRNVALTR